MENNTLDNSNIHINVLPTKKFKTTMVTFKFMAPLDYKTITARSILSKVLVRATQQWPNDKALNRHLSSLYGAYINSFVSKFKDKHVITISLEIANERYLKDSTPLFEKGLKTLKELIWNPLIIDEQFNENYVAQEKSLLTKKLEAMIDNKAQYSFLKLMNHMFENEPYKYLATGQVEQIPHVTAKNLYDTYKSMLHNDDCAIYVVGNVDKQNVIDTIQENFNIKPFKFESNNRPEHIDQNKSSKFIIDNDEVDQAKLNLGYRFPTYFGKENYYAFVVLNMMFGGDPSSVLFNEVREKQSLAYSIHSQIDGKNGFLFVLSGVSASKYEIAKDTILDEFEKLKNGNFDDDKLELAKKIIISHRHESTDRPKSIIELLHNQVLLDKPQSEEEFITAINAVTREDVIKLANEAMLDTIYVLTKGGQSE
ncbi:MULTISPECIES: EF-P 5-aminopentanol modification-associated protein YfmF [Staphylococcus]|uniref:Insulinase family protein n=1 Tax=Staphylococcus capitis TaxID=29388 RepID=A0A7Z7YXR7_STACP|nr:MULTISPECIES: pitrilysin family protein [Staphylococcus]TQC72051.1 insulinase family protein [Staphylococcus sp. SKL71207]MCC3694906.1 insulinase family protein [Staphylococcus capitis]MCM3498219.1 insulinase family protein [Staphylococcus capitis]MDH8924164.1 pitrilysin family protein [Staphylococcus capitis]MDH9623282.1 pitrilysin family protein [Staphylococcus capitis]